MARSLWGSRSLLISSSTAAYWSFSMSTVRVACSLATRIKPSLHLFTVASSAPSAMALSALRLIKSVSYTARGLESAVALATIFLLTGSQAMRVLVSSLSNRFPCLRGRTRESKYVSKLTPSSSAFCLAAMRSTRKPPPSWFPFSSNRA